MKAKEHLPLAESETRETPSVKRLPGYLSVKEAAQIMGVSERSVYGYINAGKLPGVRIGTILAVETEAVLRYERRAPGRDRVRTPAWHVPPEKNQIFVTRISVQVRQGQGEQLTDVLAQIRQAGTHRMPGTVARYVVSSQPLDNDVEIILIWRALGLPSAQERQSAIEAFSADLAEVLDWQTAVVREGQVLLHA